MSSTLSPRPLLRWDGFGLHLDLDMVELLANRELARRAPTLHDLRLAGDGEEVEISGVATWRGMPLAFCVRLAELRLHRRCFGCRVARARGPMGAPLPVGVLGSLAQRHGQGMVHFDAGGRVLLVDLRRFIPEGIELRIARVECLGRWLQVDLAPGSVATVLSAHLAGEDG